MKGSCLLSKGAGVAVLRIFLPYSNRLQGQHLDLGGSSFLGRVAGWELGHGSFSIYVFDYFRKSYLKMREAIREATHQSSTPIFGLRVPNTPTPEAMAGLGGMFFNGDQPSSHTKIERHTLHSNTTILPESKEGHI